MDNRAIGVFDSGLGGLTAVRRLHALMPRENIIYFGDTGRVPYGTRGRDIIIKYARQDVAFLRQFDLKAVAYTHLDVYKRQAEDKRGKRIIRLGWTDLDQVGCAGGCLCAGE